MSKSLKVIALAGALGAVAAPAFAQGDAAAGEKVFRQCQACHMVGENAKNRVGPELNDVIGRTAGSLDDYKYSKAMMQAGENGLVWNEDTLSEYLAKPQAVVKGTKMAFAGLRKDEDVANVIAYLKTFSAGGDSAAGEAASAEEPAAHETEMAAASPDDGGDATSSGMDYSASHTREGGEYGLGREATQAEVAAWNVDVRPDGEGLPEGSGTVSEGDALFQEQCSSCHGVFGEGTGRWPVLAGGFDTLSDERPEKTIGSYWPFLSTVFDYIHRAMPFGNAHSLSPDQVYAITAYLLYMNDIVSEDDFELSKENFTDIEMPNEGNFIDDNRESEEHYADKGDPCMTDCKPEPVKIEMRARILDVTPGSVDDDEGAGAGAVD